MLLAVAWLALMAWDMVRMGRYFIGLNHSEHAREAASPA
jgi:hypothetical protein